MRNYFLIMIAIVALASCKSGDSKTDVKQDKSNASASCDSLEYYYKQYMTRREAIAEKRNGHALIMIDTAVGNSYIEAYTRENNKDFTEGVILDRTTVAFLYKYLEANPNLKIGFSLARYSTKYWTIGRNVTDPYFAGLPVGHHGKLALIIGAYNPATSIFSAFRDQATGGVFYDDWNQEWP